MTEYDDAAPLPRNYYPSAHEAVSGLKYRLDGRDVIREVVETLKGGVKSRSGREVVFFEERRLLNDLGVERVRLTIQAGVNKVAHLTKYENEERILRQIQSITKAFIYELTANAKVWAPDGHKKVRNKHLIVQLVENNLQQSLQRGGEGFEAQITGKSWGVTEIQDNRHQAAAQGGGGGFFSRMFRRQPPPQYGGGY